jgi:glutamine synthetase
MVNRLHIADVLKSDHIKFLRIMWCDNGNVIRSKAIHLPSFKRHLHNNGWEELRDEEFLYKLEQAITITVTLQGLDAVFDEPVPEATLEPIREIQLVPDWGTLVMLPYAPGHAQTMANMMADGTEVPWELCPRDLLRRTVKKAAEAGYEIKCGAEIEFYLFEEEPFYSRGELEPVDNGAYAQNSAFEAIRDLIDKISESLFNMDIELAYYNAEAGPGQHEISLHYTDPLKLADRIVYMRETIRTLAREYGLIASFIPKIFQDSTGSGCHLHLSLWEGGRDILGQEGGDSTLSPEGEAFIAGVLEHMPALMALTTPTPNSFKRIQPRFWSGAYKVWGLDNKEAAIRVLRNHFSGGPRQFEIKTVDNSANPYIALTGVIAAGLDGIANKFTLPEPLQRDPGNLSDKELKSLGVQLLPLSVPDALEQLKQDQVLKDALGEEYYRVYTAMRRFEHEKRGDYDLEKERSLLLTRY